jgi:putative polymerase
MRPTGAVWFPAWAPTAVVMTAVLFNAALALINANVTSLSSSEVIGLEALVDAAAIAVCLRAPRPWKAFWVGLMVFLFLLDLVNGLGSAHVDPKFLRDVLIIPIFALLGVTSDRDDVVRIVIRLQWVVLAVMIFEAISPDEYGRLFNVMSYYINTRGYEQEQFWSQDTADLFISASRPDERYLLPFLNIHRLSSVFLEPVSLGNYAVIVAMACVALWDRIAPRQKLFLVVSTAMILVGCDGRFAITSVLIMIMLRFVAPALPRYVNLIYFPGFMILVALAVRFGHLSNNGDDFPSRAAGSIDVLSQMDLAALFGAEAERAYGVMDSGVAYLLYSQSIIGAAALWIAIVYGLPQRDKASIVYSHAASVYVVLNLLVSYSMFSIKTASLLWFVFGALARRTSARTAPASTPARSSEERAKAWTPVSAIEAAPSHDVSGMSSHGLGALGQAGSPLSPFPRGE